MKFAVTLLLICMLFSKGLTLTCQQCAFPLIGKCEVASCSDQCLTMTTSVHMSGAALPDVNVKTCDKADMCVSGSMNMGLLKVSNNAKCCTTDLCNSDTLPALPNQAPNGKMCYTCDANDCSKTMKCEGNEDHCITASVQQGSNTLSMKGCVSKSLCFGSGSKNTGIGITNMNCCQENLCNSAETITMGFLFMLLPLLFSTLFY